MPPFAIVGIFFREVGGCWLGPGVWNGECQGVPDLTLKSPIFRTPQKAVPRGPGIAFSRIFVDLGKLFEVMWWLFFVKNIEMEKVCLDCAGVHGLHVRPSIKLYFLGILPLIFWCFSQGTFFMHFLGAAAANASKIVPKRVPL